MNMMLAVIILVLVAFIVLALIPVVISILRVARRRSLEKASPARQAEARIMDKRTQLAPVGTTQAQRYYATFQFPDGGRLELEVSGLEWGMLVVGDEGVLEWQGPRYRGFSRAILR